MAAGGAEGAAASGACVAPHPGRRSDTATAAGCLGARRRRGWNGSATAAACRRGAQGVAGSGPSSPAGGGSAEDVAGGGPLVVPAPAPPLNLSPVSRYLLGARGTCRRAPSRVAPMRGERPWMRGLVGGWGSLSPPRGLGRTPWPAPARLLKQ